MCLSIDHTQVYLDGYHGDTSATFLVGNVDKAGKELVERTQESLDEAIAICKPGVPLNQIGKTIQKIADRYGYSISEQFSGHGIGKEFHCLPLIYHHGELICVFFTSFVQAYSAWSDPPKKK